MSLHGYELNQKLQAFGFHTIDQGNLYRLLRQLEKEDLVKSEWDTTGAGPAKRRYTITSVGVSYLKGYANQLEGYQSMLDQFFNMYSSFLELYIPSFKTEGYNREKNADKGRNHNESEEEWTSRGFKNSSKRTEPKAETNATELFVETVWDQYEESLERSNQFSEDREDAYLKSLKEVIKLNQEFRKSLSSIYRESKETNSEIVKGVSNFASKNGVKDELNFSELTDQLNDVSTRFEKIALTPIKSTFDLLDRFEKGIEENSESFIQYSRERRGGWQKVTNEYAKLARDSQKNLLNRFEESFKILTSIK